MLQMAALLVLMLTVSSIPTGIGGAFQVQQTDKELELGVWDPETGDWYVAADTDGPYHRIHFGLPGDVPFVGQFGLYGGGDPNAEDHFVVYRESEGMWYLTDLDFLEAEEGIDAGIWYSVDFGEPGDIPVPADYDGDNNLEIAMWTPSTGTWTVLKDNLGGQIDPRIVAQVGQEGDIPVPCDYDGDGEAEFAVWRPEDYNYYVSLDNKDWEGNPVLITHIEGAGDYPVCGNFDEDPADEMAIWRADDGLWAIMLENSTETTDPNDYLVVQTGMIGDVPVPADYDADGIDEVAVWRPVDGSFFINYDNTDWADGDAATHAAYRTNLPDMIPVPGQFELQ
jgi:hypothetical protein